MSVGLVLPGLASAAIDLSDGLLGDLGHIVQASGVGAELDVAQLPLSDAMKTCVETEYWQTLALSGGDDYELCITVPPENCMDVENKVARLGVPLTRIGEIVSGEGIKCLDSFGERMPVSTGAYAHFRNESP